MAQRGCLITSVAWRISVAVTLYGLLVAASAVFAVPEGEDNAGRMGVEVLSIQVKGEGESELEALSPNGTHFTAEYANLSPENTTSSENGTDLNSFCWGTERPCLLKCCPMDQAMNSTTLKCIPHPTSGHWFRPRVKFEEEEDTRAVDGEKHFELFHNESVCYGRSRVRQDDDFFIRAEDGHLLTENGTHTDEPGVFCVDYFPEKGNYYPISCSENEDNAESEQGFCIKLVYILYPMGMVVSVVFLALSLFVHAYVKELQNLHGKCLMCHMASLMMAYVFLSLVQIFGFYINDGFCITAAFIAYISFLSTFLWLNIMCIDMFIAFSGLRVMTGSAQERDKKKFILYSSYGFGVPLIVLAISLFMEFGPVPDYILKPEFKTTCWFYSDKSRIAYFLTPVGVILACNIVLFVLTAVKIFKLKKETKVLKKGDSRRHHDGEDNDQRFKLYLKLFIVMGVNWALEIISWFTGGECFWIPFDLFNTLQGLCVFIIFVWKVKIRRKVINKLCPRLAAKLRVMVPKTPMTSERRSTSTVSSNMYTANAADDNNVKLSTIATEAPAVVAPQEISTVT